MRILHTADWHIGQTLNGWHRDDEHRAWFSRVADIVEENEIDAMIIAGDVFDGVNPSGESQQILYDALAEFRRRRPHLTTVITSGNHDPARRLVAPGRVLASIGVRVVTAIHRTAHGIDATQHVIPLKDQHGMIRVNAIAIPFLRAADLPGLGFEKPEGEGSPIVAAARRLHHEIWEAARPLCEGLPVIATGHLHCSGAAEVLDGAERRILIGGEHALPPDVFPEGFDHVALGHIHGQQTLCDGRVRYSGSCFHLSVSEADHRHGVTITTVEDGRFIPRHVPVECPAPLYRIPSRGAIGIDDLPMALRRLALDDERPSGLMPFVHVRIRPDGPAVVLMARAEEIVAGHPVRSAGIRILREEVKDQPGLDPSATLDQVTPEELFRMAFRKANMSEPEERHLAAFRDATSEV